ncbi:hypothetical protein ACFLT2_02450 [Acidobacteriota bacterium]
MKKGCRCLVLILWVFLSFSSLAISQSTETPIRVLFIGNSYTYFNNLPGVLTEFGKSEGSEPQIVTDMVVAGGATLKQHFEGTRAIPKIREGNWDYVVLQEQSTLGRSKYINGMPTINRPDMFHEFVRLLHKEITRSGAKTLLMLTWAREAIPQHQATLTNAYMSIGKELGVQVAPVGLVWKDVNKRGNNIELFMEDGSHPGPQGTYLAACVLYTTITGRSPAHLPNLVKVPKMSMEGKPVKKESAYSAIELNQDDAALIHDVTWSIHQYLIGKGGYVGAKSAQNPQEPSVPSGIEFAQKDLVGIWKGTAFLDLTPDPTNLLLYFVQHGDSYTVKIELDFDGMYIPDQSHEIRNIDIANSHIQFSHPLKLNYEDVNALFKYEFVFTGEFLRGIVKMFFEGVERGVSEAQLQQ